MVGYFRLGIVEPKLNYSDKTPSEETISMMTGDTGHLKKLRDCVFYTLGIVGFNKEASWRISRPI